MNKVILIGNLGQDPQVGAAPSSGRKYARLSLATSVRWKDKATGEPRERTEWHRIVCWGDGLVDMIAQHAKKGGKVQIEGKLTTSSYEKNGVKHYSTDIVVQAPDCSFRLLGRAGPPAPNEPESRWSGEEPADGRFDAPASNYTDQPMDQEIPF
jgi:single-strand DNA-binding protein